MSCPLFAISRGRGLVGEVVMKVRIEEIPPEGRSLHLEEDGNRLFRNEPNLRFDGKVRAHVRLRPTAGSVAVSGETGAALRLQCGRCMEEFRFEMQRDFLLEYRPVSEVSERGEIQLTADEMDVQYYSEGAIDLEEVIMGQVAEAIPFKPLCSERCRGLCPECGENLNKKKCGCAGETVDPRPAKLKDLLEKQDSE